MSPYRHVSMLHVDMPNTTTVRLSKRTKTKLERVAFLKGCNLSKAHDFAVGVAEEKVDEYHGNVTSLLSLKQYKSGFKETSERIDEIVAKEKFDR